LADLPASAAAALASALLVPVNGDLGGALERCDALVALLDQWQDAFFAALPAEVDLEEEERYAAEAGVTLSDLEEEWEEWPEVDVTDEDEEEDEDEVSGQLDLDVVDLDDPLLLGHRADPLTAGLEEALVSELERDLLLLPMRVRLEALMAATALVSDWGELLSDHEKCLGHLVLVHRTTPEDLGHEALVDRHAALHAGAPGHGSETSV
jgi:hypothetical protein